MKIPHLLGVISLGIVLLSIRLIQVQGQDACASDVSECVNVAFSVFTNHPDDIPLVCSATDDFLMCIVNETRTCDPLVAASIKDSMSPLIDVYTTEPYNCNLESVNNDVLTDHCGEQMSACSLFYYQASSESQYDYNRACSLYEVYMSCMELNTTKCGPDMKAYIKKHTDNSTKEFDIKPLYCEERLQYPLDEVDANMTKCDDFLQSVDTQNDKQDVVCKQYKEYFNCAVETLTRASPRQFEFYIQGVDVVSQTFTVRPFFCESENPCMDLFKTCNESTYSPQTDPCQFEDVITCLSNAQTICAESEYTEVESNVMDLIAQLHKKYKCKEMTKNKVLGETTILPEVITHEGTNEIIVPQPKDEPEMTNGDGTKEPNEEGNQNGAKGKTIDDDDNSSVALTFSSLLLTLTIWLSICMP